MPTLAAYLDGELVFESDGPWLYPLLELESSLRERGVALPAKNLSTYDKVVGRAGALLSVRLGVTSIRTELLSRLAVPVLAAHGVAIDAVRTEERIFCATEDLLASVDDPQEAHRIIVARIEERRRSGEPIIALGGLSVVLGARRVLADLEARVYPGETVLVRGENGAGKTTLLRAMLGLVPVTAGSIRIAGHEVGSAGWRRHRRATAYVRQLEEPMTLPISAREIVEIGARSPGSRGGARRADEALHRTNASHLAARIFGKLSGGERQRVSIARALAQEPEVLLLDEPTLGLDAEARSSLIALLDGLALRQQVTVVIVSHDLQPAELPRARQLRLEEGKLFDEGRA